MLVVENERYNVNGFENVNIPWPEWNIVKEIGEGSYGKVYEIERNQHGITEKDALKIIRIPKDRRQYDEVAYRLASEDEESIEEIFSEQKEKLINEVREVKKLKSTDNIVAIKDWSVSKLDDGYSWEIYIRMDVLTPLVQYIKENKGLEEAEVIKLGEDICRALIECEKVNIVHRDIKPDNIMLSESGNYKLGDFGIARHLEDEITMTVAGTKQYMAPEIDSIEKAGKTVDIYSLGLVLYEMLNNCRPPFLKAKGKYSGLERMNANQRRLRGEELPEPANGSDDLKEIVLKACDPDPSRRYRTAAAMLKDLEDLKIKRYRAKEKETKPDRSGMTTLPPADVEVELEALRKRLANLTGTEIKPEEEYQDTAFKEPKYEGPTEWSDDNGDNIEDQYLYLETGRPDRSDMTILPSADVEVELEALRKRLKNLTGTEIKPNYADKEKPSNKLSLEDLERDLFGETFESVAEAEETKKLD